MSEPAVISIEARGIGKRFKIYRQPSNRLLEWLSLGRVRRHDDFVALDGIDLDVRRGEILGVIGENGSGKTTLLKVLSGALTPTSGTCRVEGRSLALIELSTGFNPELTGSENIVVAAQMVGLDRAYIRSKKDAILEFAELGDFIDRPLKIYSSGMKARLTFSMFAFLEPDVLMIDEALSVGDTAFQEKSYRLLESMVTAEHRTVLFVSHSLPTIRRLCHRVMWLHRGRIRLLGDPDEVVSTYSSHCKAGVPAQRRSFVVVHDAPFQPPAVAVFRADGPAAGTGDAQLAAVWLEDQDGRVVRTVPAYRPFSIYAAVRFGGRIERPSFAVRVTDGAGRLVASCSTSDHRIITPTYEPGQMQVVEWAWRPLGVGPGCYHLACTVRGRDGAPVYGPGPSDGCELIVEGARVVESTFDALMPPKLARLYHDPPDR